MNVDSAENSPIETDSQLSGESIVYFGPEPWDGLWRNRHQLMSRFARDNTVLYVEPPFFTMGRVRRLLADEQWGKRAIWPGGVRQISPGLYRLRSPWWLPFLGKAPFNHVKNAVWRFLLRRALRQLNMSAPIIWLSRPGMAKNLGVLDEKLSVYHVVDEYSGYLGLSETAKADLRAEEDELMNSVGVTIVVSKSLLKSKRDRAGRIALVPNAVDYEAYGPQKQENSSAVPADLREIKRPIIGYSGLIGRRLDLDLLLEVARCHPEWSLVLMGTIQRVGCSDILARLENEDNVHFLGAKSIDKAPKYVRAFDVCLVPYALDDRANNSSPLKIYEYAAAEKPIVTTPFQAGLEMSDIVRIADSVAAFENAILNSLEDPDADGRLAAGIELARSNTWRHRLIQISGILLDSIEQAGDSKPVVNGQPEIV